jgi:small-conductance mechanosensitive channel
MTTLIVAGSCVVGSLLLGIVLRILFGRFAGRPVDAQTSWGNLGWALLRGLVLPATVAVGLWVAAEVVELREPARGVLDRVLVVLVVLAVAVAVARLAAGLVGSVAVARSGVDQSASILVNITRVVVLAIGLLVALQAIGLSITPMLTALGVGGLAVALALQDTLANLFAGIQILASKKVQPGDFVRLDSGEDGYVVDITWRNTTIRQLTGNLVVVPNARLASAIVTNFQQPLPEMAVWFEVGVSYASDLEQVERVTIEVAQDVMATVAGGVPEFEPFVRFHTFNDFSIDFTVILRTTEFSRQYLVVHEFIKRLHARYRDEGIEIPFPIRTLMTPDGAAPVPRQPVSQAS